MERQIVKIEALISEIEQKIQEAEQELKESPVRNFAQGKVDLLSEESKAIYDMWLASDQELEASLQNMRNRLISLKKKYAILEEQMQKVFPRTMQ